jgi:superfamily II DNA or RNA helicase
MEVGVTAKWLVNNGFLSKYEYYAPKLKMEGAVWKPKGMDYDTEDAEQKLAEAGIYGDIFKYFNPNLRTIIYAPTLSMSRRVVEEINNHYGAEIAAHFDGDTPPKERKRIVEDFRSGKIRALSNRDLIGEGFDVPDCECCMLLRPTKSTALYIQQAMRCMRPREGKKAVIYDFVGNVYRHGMPDDDRTWNLSTKVKCRNESGEPDIITRTCKHCFKVYSGTSRICPYCGFDNGKTPKEIEEDKKAELERITALEKARKKKEREEAHQRRIEAAEARKEEFRKERIEEGMCRSFDDFLRLAQERNYNNPRGWAYIRAKTRGYL